MEICRTSKRVLLIFASLFSLSFLLPTTSFAQTVKGDLNNDGIINISDYNILISRFGVNVCGDIGDLNSDCRVNIFDYNIIILNFGQNVPTMPPTTPIPSESMWIPTEEIERLPITGTAWTNMRNVAYGTWGTADMKNQDNKYGLKVLAGALVYVRTRDNTLRTKVRDGIITAKRTMDEQSEWQTENGALSFGRQLGAFVIAADYIDLKSFDPVADTEFRNWLQLTKTTNVGTHGRWKNLTFTCENSANNWGTFACASRIAASIYLGDTNDVNRAANIIRAFMGERQYYPSDAPGQNGYFQHTADGLSAGWYCDGSTWTAINPPCVKLGVNVDGALVEDTARGGSCCLLQGNGIMYSWEVLQGMFVSVELLYHTHDYGNPYQWSNNALKRAMDFMERSGWGMTNPGKYVPWMSNKRYGTNYPVTTSTDGRIMTWGDWLYQ